MIFVGALTPMPILPSAAIRRRSLPAVAKPTTLVAGLKIPAPGLPLPEKVLVSIVSVPAL